VAKDKTFTEGRDKAETVAVGTDDAVLVLEERKKQRQRDAMNRPGGGVQRLASGARRPRPGRSEERTDDEIEDTVPYEGIIYPPASTVYMRRRHWGVIASFFLMVLVPVAVSGWYLCERATDRYVSTAAFSVRTEETGSAFEMLGGIVDLGSSGSEDNDILYDFIQSQEMVELIDGEIDLRAVWANADPAIDPVFAYHPPGTIEDMVTYWNRMVNIYHDTSTGLMYLQVQAFTPEDAHQIAQLIYDQSSLVINRLSDIAQEDSTRFARDELTASVDRLKDARAALTLFRNRYQIISPSSDMQSQIGILASLQAELASTLIDLDILRPTTADNDPRVVQAERRIEVIEARIDEERAKFGMGSEGSDNPGSEGGQAYADIVGEYEGLSVDLQFAEQSYAAARAAFEIAMSDTRKKSRYIAAHVQPTVAQRAEYPQRLTLLAMVTLFSFLTWALAVLIAYAIKDRR
jgi:capsular polysaccharide transport system permease protein